MNTFQFVFRRNPQLDARVLPDSVMMVALWSSDRHELVVLAELLWLRYTQLDQAQSLSTTSTRL